jgi:hypothetical protein
MLRTLLQSLETCATVASKHSLSRVSVQSLSSLLPKLEIDRQGPALDKASVEWGGAQGADAVQGAQAVLQLLDKRKANSIVLAKTMGLGHG